MKRKKINKVIYRKCFITGQILPKDKLIRIAKMNNGKFIIDLEQKLLGRGAYIKKDKSLVPILLRKKYINRVFKTKVPIKTYELLEKELNKYE